MAANEINGLARKHCTSPEARSSRTRRWSTDRAKAAYYKHHREMRFARHFGLRAA